MDPLNEIVLKAVIRQVTGAALETFRSLGNGGTGHSQAIDEEKLGAHLAFVASWCSGIQVLGMQSEFATATSTIPLTIQTASRVFRGTEGKRVDEQLLLSSESNHLLLGSPGSGKTTTLKRVARSLLFSDHHDAHVQFPIVVRLRDIISHDGTSGASAKHSVQRKDALLTRHILDAVGVQCESIREEGGFNQAATYRWMVDGAAAEDYLVSLVDNASAVLLIDGIDEVHPVAIDAVCAELASLATKLTRAKIIATCRLGERLPTFQSIETLCIQPLSASQIESIATATLEGHEDFLSALSEVPFDDVADRPLLLTLLMLLFDNYGELPSRPQTVYHRSVDLLLEKWNLDQGMKSRVSKYAGFDAPTKKRFLSEMAYRLTAMERVPRFTQTDLLRCFNESRRAYDLPEGEATQAIAEIESHTGIVTQIGYDEYEFSHLSIQEYLSAEYIVNSAFSTEWKTFFRTQPNALAVAVALSYTSNKWFAALILSGDNLQQFTRASLLKFCTRLVQEKPYFASDELLGAAIVKVFSGWLKKEDEALTAALRSLCQHGYALESVRLFLDNYGVGEPPAGFSSADYVGLYRQTALDHFGDIGKRAEELAIKIPRIVALSKIARKVLEEDTGYAISASDEETVKEIKASTEKRTPVVISIEAVDEWDAWVHNFD